MFLPLGRKLSGFTARWAREDEAVATVEAALVFPILLTLLLGTFDMGNAILANQKAIRSSQVTADIITRNMSVSSEEINEAINAGELALQPLNTDSYGVDIVSIRFDDEGEPGIVWRETRNMTVSGDDVLNKVTSLAEANNGVVVVTSQYTFEPVFAGFIVGEILMQETAFARGRRSAVVNME